MTDTAAILQDYLNRNDIAGLMLRGAELRYDLWNPLVQIVLSVRDERDTVDGWEVQWNSVPLRDLNAPVTRQDIEAWVAPERPDRAFAQLAILFDRLDPPVLSLAELVMLVAAQAPSHLTAVLPDPWKFQAPDVFDLLRLAGSALGTAMLRAKSGPDSTISSWLKHGTPEAIGVYLRDGLELVNADEIQDLGRALPPDAPEWGRKAYGQAVIVALGRTRPADKSRLRISTAVLDAADIEAILLAARKKPVFFPWLALQASAQGRSQGAQALAALLPDKKFGLVAARCLSEMGAEGKKAAARWVKETGKEAERARPLADKILALPDAPAALAGYQYELPRFGLDLARFLLNPGPLEGDPPGEPAPLESLQNAFSKNLRSDLLSPSGWADALQIISLDRNLNAVPATYARARERGWLGRGSDPRSLCAALDRLDWKANVTREFYGNKAGIGHILLWAGASREVFLHALARFFFTAESKYLGQYEELFIKALDELAPPWAGGVRALIYHLEFAERDMPPYLGAPPVLATLPENTPVADGVELGPLGAAWVIGAVRGAQKVRITLRGAVTLTIDAVERIWTLSLPGRPGGKMPLAPSVDDELSFGLEMYQNLLTMGICGARTGSTLEDLPPEPGMIRIEAEGEAPVITRLVAYEKYSRILADAASRLLAEPDNGQAVQELQALGTHQAAHALASVAALSEEELSAPARAALAGMGAVAEPFLQALGLAAAPAAPRFTVRSFEEVARDFAALAPKKKLNRGRHQDYEALSFGDIEEPRPKSGQAVPFPAVYLSSYGMSEDPWDLVGTFSTFPALTKGWDSRVEVSCTQSPGEYMILWLEIDVGEYDSGLWYECLAATWRVSEGWAIAVWNEDAKGLAQVMGMLALPPELEWHEVGEGTLGCG